MAEKKEKRKGSALPYFVTPLLLLMMTGGLILLGWSLAPAHQIQKYLGIAFMDNLKTVSANDGLNIIENDIKTDAVSEDESFSEGAVIYPVFGEQYAVLQADAIDLTVPVFYGSNAELLSRGACQSTQSAVIGETGNTVIDAHVNTFFADLSKLEPDDTVTLYTKYGQFTYRVTEKIEFNKTDKRYLGVTETEYLTLYTCSPQVIGSSDLRIGVRCEPVTKQFYQQNSEKKGD